MRPSGRVLDGTDRKLLAEFQAYLLRLVRSMQQTRQESSCLFNPPTPPATAANLPVISKLLARQTSPLSKTSKSKHIFSGERCSSVTPKSILIVEGSQPRQLDRTHSVSRSRKQRKHVSQRLCLARKPLPDSPLPRTRPRLPPLQDLELFALEGWKQDSALDWC